MKKTYRIMLVAFVAMSMVAFTGCGKEEYNGGSNGGGGDVPAGWVDLGLPSGLLWAECNVGATAPEEFGDYIAWGETSPKGDYTWSTYAYGNADNQLTKYCNKSEYGLNGFTDNLTTLEPGDDAATVQLGNGARTPTKEEWLELVFNTTAEWTTLNGVSGCRHIATNGNSIFLPAAGLRFPELNNLGICHYWSATFSTSYPSWAWIYWCHPDGCNVTTINSMRSNGLSVRAVRDR